MDLTTFPDLGFGPGLVVGFALLLTFEHVLGPIRDRIARRLDP